MFKKFLPIVFLFAGFQANGAVISDLTERDLLSHGDGLLTFDSSTGLEWLDLDLTLGNSILDTEATSYYTSDGFRWAKPEEIEALFNAAIFSTVWLTRISYDADDILNSSTFVGYLGGLDNKSMGVSRDMPSPDVFGGYGLGYVESSANHGRVNHPRDNCCILEDAGYAQVGSWLVRKTTTTVPEPSIIALFGAGLVGLGFARRRKSRLA